MARAAVAKSEPKGIINWADELAKEADVAAGMESTSGGGGWFSLRSGMLSLGDAAMPNNEMAVVILDSMLENVFYDGAYNPDAISPPKCFAYGRDEATMAPHAVVFAAGQEENDKCSTCQRNEWGSAERGKGKACANRRRLSLIAAGDLSGSKRFEPYATDHFETSPVALLKLPVTSVKLFANYVRQVTGVIRRPPFGVITLVKVVPDPKTQFKVVCSLIDNVPDHLLPVIMRRREESRPLLEAPMPLTFDNDDEPAQPAPRGKVGAARAQRSKF